MPPSKFRETYGLDLTQSYSTGDFPFKFRVKVTPLKIKNYVGLVFLVLNYITDKKAGDDYTVWNLKHLSQ